MRGMEVLVCLLIDNLLFCFVIMLGMVFLYVVIVNGFVFDVYKVLSKDDGWVLFMIFCCILIFFLDL